MVIASLDKSQNQLRKTTVKRSCLAAALAAISALINLDAWAQPFPSRSIRIIVPLAAGGAADNMARITSERIAQAIGQSITVENLTGAGGNVGAAQVARAEPNGYTLLATIDSVLTINPHVTPKMPFNAIDDFEPWIKLVDVPLYLAAHRSFSGRTLPEAIVVAKTKPGQFAIGSSGPGSPHHIAIELLKRSAGVQRAHVPYRGAAQSVTSWLGFLAPAKTPRPVLERLAIEYAAAARIPELAERLKQGGMDPAPVSLDEIGKLLRADHARMGKIVRDAAITLN